MSKKSRITILLSIAFLSFIGCKSDDKPENVLSEEKMTKIFMDIYETESVITSLDLGRDSAMVIFKEYEEKMFENTDYTKEEYYNSLVYYYDHPDKLEKIYEVIIDSLTLRESKIKAIEESKRNKNDSIRNVNVLK